MINYSEEILRLKREKNAIILAHYYQEPGIQEIADFVGDSLGLSQQAAKTDADIIVFAGVHFMAETAKILNPAKKVLLPELKAGCSLAESCLPEDFREFIALHPHHAVVSYINCSAAIKAMSHVICTSSNAIAVVNSIPADHPVIFAPDKNLGAYVARKTGRDLILWDGVCEVHEAFSFEKIVALVKKYPEARLVVHPESAGKLLDIAHFIGSTSAMIDYVRNGSHIEYIIATEAGILHKMREAAPWKRLIPAPVHENNSCACSECPYMKMNTLEKLYNCLKNETPEIIISENVRRMALVPLERMLAISGQKNRITITNDSN